MPRARRLLAGLATVAVAAGLAVPGALSPAAAAPNDDPISVTGDDWQIDAVAGGYEVTVDLDEPLPVVSDAPILVADGESLGLATESADGLSLTVRTTDASVLRSRTIEAGWASAPDGGEESRGGTATQRELAALGELASDVPALAADPAAHGSYDWTESIYKFGEQSVDLLNIGGVRGEMEGKLYLPTTGGARPVVLLLHGRHSWCTNGSAWPCSGTGLSIPSYLGYDGTARALASNGYSVVSISANAVNANDNQLAPDQGAMARGQLILDTFEMLQSANGGRAVSMYDAQTGDDVTLDQAFTKGTEALALRASGFVGGVEPLDTVRAADLVGKFDLTRIGMMGHSRGGEGVTAAATLNAARETPFGVRTILPLAPVDFGRMTVPDVAMNVILPYCDGDVSNQQGQHMLDDSRYAFGDDALRTGTWAMGANHNFYNTVWTPGRYSIAVSDDWSGTNINSARATEPTCGTNPSVAATSIRMTPQEQYDQGTSYMAGWFRLTLGGDQQFLPMFDGTNAVPAALNGEDVRTQATAPSSARATIATLEEPSSLVRVSGSGATATVCASAAGRTVPATLPACSSQSTSTLPHWTPASNGANVPASPMTKFAWTSPSAQLRVSIPAARRDASSYQRLVVKAAADETVPLGTDLTLTVVDGKGATWSGRASELNPLALNRLPFSETSTSLSTLKKIVLQQINVEVSALAAAGLDTADLREVRFAGATGLDQSAAGAAVLTDLAFERSAVGTLASKRQPVIAAFAPFAEEGSGPGTLQVAAVLDAPATVPVTGYVSVLGSATGRAGIGMERVSFAPGEVCKAVTVPTLGDLTPSSSAFTQFKVSVINTAGAVMSKDAIRFTRIREDDGVTGSATPEPPYGVSGDVCAEFAGLTGGEVDLVDETPADAAVAVEAAGFRAGETVVFTAPGVAAATVQADGAGVATAALTLPADVARGALEVTATSAGTGRVATGSTAVRDATTTTLGYDAESLAVDTPIDLVATVASAVEGADLAGTVAFFDGETSLGTAETVDGVATLSVAEGFGPGSHTLSAVFAATATASGSSSAPVTVLLDRRASSIALSLADTATRFGAGSSGTVTVGGRGASEGEVELSIGSQTSTLQLDDEGTAAFDLPAGLAVGSYRVSATFAGTDTLAPSETVQASYRVAKALTTARIGAPTAVRAGGSFTVRARIDGSPAVNDTVQIRMSRNGGSWTTVRTVRLSSGAADVQFYAPGSLRNVRVRAVFTGSDTHGASSSPVRTVRVVR